MKKIIIVLLLAGILLLNISSCADKDMDYSYSIKDALKISAYLFDESINMDEPIYYNDGDEYTLEQLKMNEVRVMAPQSAMQREIPGTGLVLYLEFDGIIKVVSENKDVRLTYNKINGYETQLAVSGYVNAYPYRIYTPSMVDVHPFIPGTEYYLNVNAYKFENEDSPIIRAKLKLVALDDAVEEPVFFHDGKPESACVSIELISYEYSDVYKLMDDIADDEE
ncbi:MAG: hypothetical protein FWD71_01090 [Oscillospiraceae bacterium]|nr:hypothetical protein [Oscillospiraceae bacterium]